MKLSEKDKEAAQQALEYLKSLNSEQKKQLAKNISNIDNETIKNVFLSKGLRTDMEEINKLKNTLQPQNIAGISQINDRLKELKQQQGIGTKRNDHDNQDQNQMKSQYYKDKKTKIVDMTFEDNFLKILVTIFILMCLYILIF